MPRQQLLLIPGLVCDAQVWRHQTSYLADIAHIAIPPVDQSETMVDMAKNVLLVAPRQFAVAGFSMGGYIALEMLRQAPERITRLALLDTTARDDTNVKARVRIDAIDAYLTNF